MSMVIRLLFLLCKLSSHLQCNGKSNLVALIEWLTVLLEYLLQVLTNKSGRVIAPMPPPLSLPMNMTILNMLSISRNLLLYLREFYNKYV